MAASPADTKSARQRVPAAERRDALIDAAMEEFAHGGLHGTPVDRIARRVGVAQPYVFSLFGSKRELFLAAVDRCFEQVGEMFDRAAAQFDPEQAEPGTDLLTAMGHAYVEMLSTQRHRLMLQLQAYAACDDPLIRDRVRQAHAGLVARIQRLTGFGPDELDEFFRYGAWLTVGAAMGIEHLSAANE